MHSTEIFSKCSPRPVSIKVESKEDFFCIKKNQKRMKISQCFSQPIQRQNTQETVEDFNLIFNRQSQFAKNQLQSTFGSESVLAFKVKPPKRKKNIKIQSITTLRSQYQSESDNETSSIKKLHFDNKKIKYTQSPEKNHTPIKIQQNTLTIHQFYLMGKLGQGTYSEVFRAFHKQTGFLCAIKVLQKWKMIELNVVQNVLREIKINYFMDHPNIAKIYSFFDDRNYIYLICEYATDKNIFELVNQPKIKLKKGLFSDNVSRITYQLCDAVRFLHNHSVIHRDIKPQNVLLTMFDTVKLCDFGWSVYNPSKQMRSTLCGTPLYLAPQLIKQADYDQSVDVWAIGVLTYQMLTNQNPFKINQLKDLAKVLYDDVKFDGFRNKNAVDFIKRAMQKDPVKRKTIYELINHPFLLNFHQNHAMIW